MAGPLISIIIPTFNRTKLIRETLDSVLAQTYSNWECIIVDDGSTDKTEQDIFDYLTDDRFFYFQRPRHKRKGASACRNYGLEKATGDYVQFLDSDDLLKKNKLEEQLEILKRASNNAVATCKFGSFSCSSQLQVKTQYNAYNNYNRSVELLYTFGKYDEYFPPHVYLVPRNLINKTEGWNEELSYNDDGEYFTRILIHASEVVYCGSTEVYYRAGDQNRLSILDSKEKTESAYKSWKLIEEHLSSVSKRICSRYVRNGKRNIREQLKEPSSSSVKGKQITGGIAINWIEKIFSRSK